MPSERILVVDDDVNVATGLRAALEYEGYDVTVAADGLGALTAITEVDPAVVLLDIGLPGLDGLAVTRALRTAGDLVPILVVTARSTSRDLVNGLDVGADDYLVKPFDLDELLARVRALVRRARSESPSTIVSGEFVLRVSDRWMARQDDGVQLTRQETLVASSLMGEPDRVYSRNELTRAVWGEEQPNSNSLDVCVSSLRRKLASISTGTRPIETVRGLGYRFRP